ncbi:MAG: pyruvate dehydrogenase complex dihydrolipoamide acetyltransferase [Pseudomonadota bacterium]
MPIEIFMPALSPTMEKGNLAKWLVKEGEAVTSGAIIAEIETDKATMEVESIDDGTMGKILVPEGTEDVPVGTPIALLLEEGEDESALKDAAPKPKSQPKPSPGADAKAEAPKEGVPEKQSQANGAPAPAATPTAAEDGRVKASPLARRIAAQAGIDLAAVKGSGPGGRIVKRDLEEVGAARPGAPAPETPARAPAAMAAAPLYPPPADVPHEEVKLSGMRKVIAKRMTESKTTVPHFYLTVDVALDKLLAQRKELNARLEKSGVKLSVNDFVIRAVALALKKVPAANAQYAGDRMYLFKRQDISVAVAVPGGLVTPVIRDAGAKGLSEISLEMKALAEKARDGKLIPEDYQGGTFSISNLGMFGIKQFEAVINPPQGAILAVGAGEARAVVKDGALAIATMMSVTLAVDHRVLDGAIGAEFLAAFKALIEDPLTMLL